MDEAAAAGGVGVEKVAICPVIEYTRQALTTLIATIIGLDEHRFLSANGNVQQEKKERRKKRKKKKR